MSKLRSDELVNMEGDGAPSFPQGATTIEPTADNQVATKLYVDSALSAASGNAVSDTAPANPAVGSFWTDTSVSPSLLKTWNGNTWIEFAGTAAAAVGVVVSLPSLSATNLEHAPATITASAAQVSGATLFITKWYKDDVEIVGATGLTYVATEPGVYRYEERWADASGNVLTPSLNKTIELLTIQAPSIISPVVDTGFPDFDYTAESSAIANVGTIDVLDGSAFSITSWSGNDSNDRTIQSGIDNTEDSLIWIKSRDTTGDHVLAGQHLVDSGYTNLDSSATRTGGTETNYVKSFLDNGFVLGNSGYVNGSGNDYIGWNFLKTPGFFDVVTFTGNGSTQTISHNLGSVPAMMIIKDISRTEDWMIYHHSLSSAYGNPYPAEQLRLRLNEPDSSPSADPSMWNNTAPTSTEFSVGNSSNTNHYGDEYVAYLFADNPSNEIKCGSYLGNAVGGGSPAVPNQIDCGFRPKFVLIKNVASSTDWLIFDEQLNNYWLKANNTGSESFSPDLQVAFNDNGFSLPTGFHYVNQDNTEHIYLAIGSPKETISNTQLTLTDTTVSKVSDGSLVSGSTIDQVLTVGETVQADTTITNTVNAAVFDAVQYTGNSTHTGSGIEQVITTGIDNTQKSMIWFKNRNNNVDHSMFDTERTPPDHRWLRPNTSGVELDSAAVLKDRTTTGFTAVHPTNGSGVGTVNPSGEQMVAWNFRAAPGFFDIQTYTGISEGAANQSQTISHDLGSEPGMIILKAIDDGSAWFVYHKELEDNTWIRLNENWVKSGPLTGVIPPTQSSTEFNIGADTSINKLNKNYVAYLFADTPGKIKCGTYTGTHSTTQTIDCGFEPGFVLIKATDRASDWVVTDYKLMASGQYFHPNNDQELKTNGIVGSASNGFTVASGSGDVNNNGTTHVYMAIAKDLMMDIDVQSTASGTVSASSGSTITLSDVSGTWSTGMKIQGVTTDTKDNPDRIDASAVTFTSSEPATTSGTVSTWDYAEWNLSYDAQFSSVVHEKAVPLTGTGTQAGPDDFPIQAGTEYFVRTKYASSLPTGQSDWSAVTRFLTKQPGGWTTVSTQDIVSNPSGQNRVTKVIKDGDYYIIFGYGQYGGWISKTTDFQTFESFASLPSPAMTITSACSFGPGKYIVVGRPTSGNAWNCVHTTTNGGASWNLYPLNNGNLGTIYSPNPSITDVAWDGANSFCITIGNNVNENQYTHIWISNDLGQTFNQVSEPSPQHCTWNKVTFFGGKFVLFGGRSARESGTWTSRPRIAYSTNSDYSGWSNATFPGSDDTGRMFYDFFVSNNKLYTAPFGGGGSPTMLESADGMTFTSVGGQNSSYSSYGNFLASDGETIVLKNYDTRVMTTQDLNLPFQTHYAPTSPGTLGFDYVGDRFIAYHYDDSNHTYPVLSYNYTGLES